MTTFERYFIDDKSTHSEEKGAYYKLRNESTICDKILDEFSVVGKHRHIINGHVPVKVGKGENPIKADGRLMVIDGGFARAYHSTTGIAGYTLVYHSRGFQLVQHAPFNSTEEAVLNGTPLLAPGEEGINGVTLASAMYLSTWRGLETIDLNNFPHEEFYERLMEKAKNATEKKGVKSQTVDINGTY
jgi:succinate dehydrogenase/fumarate reductase flavoprotein subunit